MNICDVCKNSYNETDHLPYFLEDCQETICSTCYNNLKEKKCPKCKVPITAKPKENKDMLKNNVKQIFLK